jgi:excisionase family DNA binding protein
MIHWCARRASGAEARRPQWGLPKAAATLRCVEPSATDRSGRPAVEWLSSAEAAARLGITPRTLYRFIDEGQLPAYRFGRVIRLKATEVDAFIDLCRIEPGTLDHLYADSGPNGTSDAPVYGTLR